MYRGLGRRGQSSPIAVVLVLSMVVAGSLAVVTLGAQSLSDTRETMDVERAEKGLTQLDSNVAMVALGSAGGQELSLSRTDGAAYRLRDDAGWMTVAVTNTSNDSTKTVMNATLGSIAYENDGRSVAYQGGGVWKTDGNGGSLMVSPPEFHYRDATLTLPLVTVSGEESLDGRIAVRPGGRSTQHFPNASADEQWVNPLDGGRVNVTVKSEYYRAWGQFFEERTDGDATLDHANETATVTLVVPAGPQTVTNAVAATSAGGEIVLAGSGDQTRTDSYNSSKGTGLYADTKTHDGSIRTAGDVTVKGNSQVNGSLASGGKVTVKGGGVVTRDAGYTDDIKVTGSGGVDGSIEQLSGVDGIGPVDAVIERRYENATEDNDNGDASAISGTTLDDGDQTLSAGEYHLDRLVLDGETLTLDTGTDGTISIAVRDYVQLKNDGRIHVVGNGTVRLYVDGQATTASDHHFSIEGSGGQIDVDEGQNASQFWLYGRGDFQGRIDGTSGDTHLLEGVVFAPGGTLGSSSFTVEKGSLYGGVVTGTVMMDNGGQVHYDRSLKRVNAVPPAENIVRLTYLHVSEIEIEARD
ncbi:hypothetical protein ACAH01_10110 [Halomicrobium sp. HM KBTZ05]|uniref:DUF7289 family protein n=1 Tax=Halomicrobium sp. HM KBTZ05 TaxID=3242663 RepID=UPI003558C4FB